MTTCRSATVLTAGAVIYMTAGAAVAEVTPTEVWEDWKAYMTGFGFEITASEAQSGNDLEITDIVLNFDAPEEGGATEIRVPELSFRDNGDGTVAIVFPDRMPLSVMTEGPEAVSFDMVYTADGMDVNVAGDASGMTYTYTADMLGLALENLTAQGEPVEVNDAALRMQDVKGTTVTGGDDLRQSRQVVSSGPVSYSFSAADPENAANVMSVTGRIDSLTMTGEASVPEDMDTKNMSAALAAGFAVDGEYTFGPGASSFEFTEEGAVTRGTSQSAGGNLTVAIDGGKLRYGGTTRDVAVEVVTPDLPFPVSLAMQEARFGLDMPVARKEEAQDFGLTFVLGDLTVSDQIWAMFDPEGKLPRDPATLALELSGKARVLADWMDPAQMAAIEKSGEAPAEMDALSIDRLQLSVAGAELTGEGDLAFDNEDTQTYPGMPKPVGDVSLRLTGVNTLLDKLVEMGLLPEDQVMGARMMMGVFANPVEGEDALKSEIEFTEDGQILANGQRLK